MVRGSSTLTRVLIRLTDTLDRRFGWDRLPVPIGVAMLVGMRAMLRERNLHDTETSPGSLDGSGPAELRPRRLAVRTANGTYNDLEQPRMGSAGTRFGRNVPIAHTYLERESDLLSPNPRLVSRELLARKEFIPATTLNLLAAAWLQFMVHDWFSHGKNDKDRVFEIPLTDDDPWPERPMRILRTTADRSRSDQDADLPPTFVNTMTAWWDASQIYGNDDEMVAKLRSGFDGKLTIGDDGLLPIDPRTGVDATGVSGNWWIGLSLLHGLFALEHNAICDRLRSTYPYWSDDTLFERARLINAALLAKIHTVEWTTGILGHPTLQIGMRGNWWGAAGERIYNLVGRLGSSELISGIPGSTKNHFGVPYSLTEEFVAVYRMHPLVPDEFRFRSRADDSLILECPFPDASGRSTRGVLEKVSVLDALYSLGTDHPGAITLHNYPNTLRDHREDDGSLMDLAAIDVLRIRERGVPRYNEFRRLLHLAPAKSFEDLTANPEWQDELRRVYDNDIERVDLMVGLYAELPPKGFGFSDTAFRIFILMASRRLNSDRFFTTDYTPQVYSPEGLKWIADNTMSTVLLRHYPQLATALAGVKNAFAPWQRAGSNGEK